ncbi:pyrroloquinoline quinone biosynthesis protein [Lasius niger]|uniref:Pyrroloquinoline quinone biosynthesis protein n=1 Tax=Lasius niger TaxID=67767 RepID=A0A0J7KK06_LASNI|nr:pyrroloquinoline quinone biosynthesis protein [Lasius niger]
MAETLRPLSLLAEITHRCPLACAYCANPIALNKQKEEKPTSFWKKIIDQASALDMLHIHFSGGEPLLRPDLEELIQYAHERDLYTNLITSGLPCTRERLEGLYDAGLDHIQLSFQDIEEAGADMLSGVSRTLERKLKTARWIKELGFPLTLNFVLHKGNLSRIPQMLKLSRELEAGRVELANVQYHGWATLNRKHLLPSRQQIEKASKIVLAEREKSPAMVIDWVTPDFYSAYPKPCMGGWARKFLNVTPAGKVLPCHGAEAFKEKVPLPDAEDASLKDIWEDSELFNLYRGTGWMKKPCTDCPRAEIDWGGCRCQALALLGDGDLADPVCRHSSSREIINDLITEANGADASANFRYRKI